VLPEKQVTDAGEIVEVTFEEVKPGPGKDYRCHPTIKTFLEETVGSRAAQACFRQKTAD
jgi:hypothetical protein